MIHGIFLGGGVMDARRSSDYLLHDVRMDASTSLHFPNLIACTDYHQTTTKQLSLLAGACSHACVYTCAQNQ